MNEWTPTKFFLSQNRSGIVVEMGVHVQDEQEQQNFLINAGRRSPSAQEDDCEIHARDLLSLASSGIIGVLIKHSLNTAFSSQVGAPFFELPANMVGCFFVGFLVRFTSVTVRSAGTGFAGSVTSYASWNHAMVAAAYDGKWLFATCSLFIGLELAYMSYEVGADVADMLSELCPPVKPDAESTCARTAIAVAGETWTRTSTTIGVLLWTTVAVLTYVDAERRHIWLASALAPQGVWIRLLLAKLNPRSTKFAVGTWAANFVASGIHTALEFLKLMNPTTASLVDAFQTGCLGSMGTLSTVVAETHILHKDESIAKAYSYIIFTIASSLILAGIVYAIPLIMFKTDTEMPLRYN